MQRALLIVYELVLVVLSIVVGRLLADQINLIPRALIRLPEVFVSKPDALQIGVLFTAACALTFIVLAFTAGPGTFSIARRTAVEILGLVFSFAAAAAGIFLLTPLPTDPEFLLAVGLVAGVAFVLSHVFSRQSESAGGRSSGRVSALLSVIWETIKAAVRPWGLVALLVAATPLVMAKLFVGNRDFANFVTRVRISMQAHQRSEWGLVNAFSDLTFRQPMAVRIRAGTPDVAYILERHGRVYQVALAAPHSKLLMLDISARVGDVDVENGALGFDLHPEFGRAGSPNSTFAYIYYTSVIDGAQRNRLSRFDLASDDAAATEQELIDLDRRDDGFHNGGSVEFGPDGFLYIGIGEASDRSSFQRIDQSLVGGVMRIDVDQRGAPVSHAPLRQPAKTNTAHYFIPNDNPFVGQPDAVEEFWALGLRNPYRFSFDPQTGELWVGDVGSDKYEEVNVVVSGGNYQFPFIEGVTPTAVPRPQALVGDEVGPVHYYLHTAYDRAIIGGNVYRGEQFPELTGHYLFADNYSGKLMEFDSSVRPAERATVLVQAPQVAQRGVSSIFLTAAGDVLMTTLGKSNDATGLVLRLVRAGDETPDALIGAVETNSEPISAGYAAEIFNSNCGRCHGLTGAGDGPDAEKMPVQMPNFTLAGYQSVRSDEELFRVITDGGAALGISAVMPPWERILSTAEISALVTHIRQLSTAQQ